MRGYADSALNGTFFVLGGGLKKCYNVFGCEKGFSMQLSPRTRKNRLCDPVQ